MANLVSYVGHKEKCFYKFNGMDDICQVELNADILTEMIMDELMQEAARDMSVLSGDVTVDGEDESLLSQTATDLQNIIHRLGEMEVGIGSRVS